MSVRHLQDIAIKHSLIQHLFNVI